MTIEDVIKKSILPLAFMVFWFWMTKTIMKVSGQTDWFWWIFIAGLPFGIHKMRLILIPIAELQELLRMSHTTVTKLLYELDSVHAEPDYRLICLFSLKGVIAMITDLDSS